MKLDRKLYLYILYLCVSDRMSFKIIEINLGWVTVCEKRHQNTSRRLQDKNPKGFIESYSLCGL